LGGGTRNGWVFEFPGGDELTAVCSEDIPIRCPGIFGALEIRRDVVVPFHLFVQVIEEEHFSHYNGAPRERTPLVFVGKGITFDTGGIALKPPLGMKAMRADMGIIPAFSLMERTEGCSRHTF
jgi:hypothetical protein